MIKRLILILICSAIAGCLSIRNALPGVDRSPSWKAVYLTHGPGELLSEDLQSHPEVTVVPTFEELKKFTRQKIAIWIDKNATPFDSGQEEWINEAPQAYYPIVLVGTSDTLHAFKGLLRLCCFMGPAGDYPGYDAPGFSVIQWKEGNEPDARDVVLIQGFNQKPTVQAILEITNVLLAGKLKPAPTAPMSNPPSQTANSTNLQVLLFDDWPKDGFPTDTAKITAITLEKNILQIQVVYQGGCQEHTFALHAWTGFLLSNPPQGELYLSQDAHGDPCKETIEKRLSFDLTPFDKSRTGRHANPLILRITEPAGGSFANEPFMPLIEWP